MEESVVKDQDQIHPVDMNNDINTSTCTFGASGWQYPRQAMTRRSSQAYMKPKRVCDKKINLL